ncbi:hypothetical protein [Halosegnis longus]|uniref:hypothetical protein n=1 Tax=Halosegnis longus TaxID=2216012 RepID=UPI00129D3302|nr:hypothetical protein [Halosegnis longus]
MTDDVTEDNPSMDNTDTSAADVVAEIRDALGMDDDETVAIQTPQFERNDDVTPSEPPLTVDAMDRLKHADESELTQLGLQKWSDETGLWLLPHEWHPYIPPEYPLLDIFDEWTSRGEMPATPDKRFGILSAGIVPDFEKRNGHNEDTGQSRGT